MTNNENPIESIEILHVARDEGPLEIIETNETFAYTEDYDEWKASFFRLNASRLESGFSEHHIFKLTPEREDAIRKVGKYMLGPTALVNGKLLLAYTRKSPTMNIEDLADHVDVLYDISFAITADEPDYKQTIVTIFRGVPK